MTVATSPTDRGMRALLTQPVAVRRPRPVMSKAIPVRARVNPMRPGSVRRPRPVTPRPLAGGQRPRRGPPPMLSTLDREREAERERARRDRSRELADRERALRSFLDPKIGKHGRIENGSGPPKTLPTHYVAERAVMSGERQPRKRRRQGASAANEQPPPPQLPKEPRRQKLARAHRTSNQKHFHPSRWTEVEREERKPRGTQHKVHPETSPPLPPLSLPS